MKNRRRQVIYPYRSSNLYRLNVHSIVKGSLASYKCPEREYIYLNLEGDYVSLCAVQVWMWLHKFIIPCWQLIDFCKSKCIIEVWRKRRKQFLTCFFASSIFSSNDQDAIRLSILFLSVYLLFPVSDSKCYANFIQQAVSCPIKLWLCDT